MADQGPLTGFQYNRVLNTQIDWTGSGTQEAVTGWRFAPQLVQGSRRRVMDVEEFERIYRRYAAPILAFARRCVGRADVAEDLASEAFLELLRRRETIDPDRLPAWLYTVVRNRAIDYWRRQKLEAGPQASNGDEPPRTTPFDWSVLEASGLNATHRLCLTLRYVQGMNREEIAGLTGLRETQVKGYLRYGLELLRKNMVGDRGEEAK
jgi:RNA polymerase sigma factor (sigma-70 family)